VRVPVTSSSGDDEREISLGSKSDARALDFLRRLWGLDHALDSASKRMLRDLGVTGPQRVVLRLVVEAGEMGPTEIAEQMMHHPATTSALLKKLEESGFIVRRESREDRRRTVVVATEAGRALGVLRTGTIEARVGEVLKDLEPEDVAACERVLQALSRALMPEAS
jgi:DNA-binding MarR family transcriptional regulator